MTEGDVWCWGANDANQLGDAEGLLTGPGVDRSLPVHVRGFGVREGTGLKAVSGGQPLDRGIAANATFTCAIAVSIGNGEPVSLPKVHCWGKDDTLQRTPGEVWTPRMPAVGFPVSIAAGDAFTCMLLDDRRSVACWGAQEVGQLGTGTVPLSPSNDPLQVDLTPLLKAGETVTSLVAGAAHACVLLDSGRALCWGSNQAGQLKGAPCPCAAGCEPESPTCGRGASFGPVEVAPLPLRPGERVERLAAGVQATCAVTSEGRGLCWGGNVSGELGHLPQVGIYAPSPMEEVGLGAGPNGELSRLREAVFGLGQHACGIDRAGEAFCWGSSVSGQAAPLPLPSGELPAGCQVLVGAVCLPAQGRQRLLAEAGVDIVAGSKHSCALLADGTVWCWGDNARGQRGDGGVTTVLAPELPPTRVKW
ncbi:MAG TPA: hypothetical protein VFS00_29835, partial [Polyangiaceae bacterium]|nr:hypothetical protein [Polyangiaceae bacterium]